MTRFLMCSLPKEGFTMMFKIKDPGSALTHFIAMLLALVAATPLLIKAAGSPDQTHILALTIFIISMILLYAASTVYHTLDISPKINQILRKVDHMMIFILIAGTYTPVCMLVLGDRTGWALLALVWGLAMVGILINALWITCPKWFFFYIIYLFCAFEFLPQKSFLSCRYPIKGMPASIHTSYAVTSPNISYLLSGILLLPSDAAYQFLLRPPYPQSSLPP